MGLFQYIFVLILAAFVSMGSGQVNGPVPTEQSSLHAKARKPEPVHQYRGVDASFVPWYEQAGVSYFDEAGEKKDPIQLLADQGANLLRIRVFVDPGDGHNGLADALELARRGRDAGMDLLVDFHFSGSWADPAMQEKPQAWEGLDDEALAKRVRMYTRDVIGAMYAQGTRPEIVQIGNEIIDGMLWPTGQISVNGFAGLATMLNAAIAGVEDAAGINERPQVMIHIDRGADLGAGVWFYDGMLAAGVEFDMIGLSYYPWWHGSFDSMRLTVRGLAGRYDKPVMLCEVAYPWTLGWDDKTNNFVGVLGQLLPGFDATPQGQRAYLNALSAELRAVPGGRGVGWCYWGAAFVADPSTPGSVWENVCLFDFEHKLHEGAASLGD
ncbi:MAG: glycosyl hydrolase 53 family protein [Phycisphaerales bacterium]|nr:glycosyl hydrolase 53 family protein [Phycisphaerales bacterium]